MRHATSGLNVAEVFHIYNDGGEDCMGEGAYQLFYLPASSAIDKGDRLNDDWGALTSPSGAERASARGRTSSLVETAQADAVGACGCPSDLIETAVVGSMGACSWPSDMTETAMFVAVLGPCTGPSVI